MFICVVVVVVVEDKASVSCIVVAVVIVSICPPMTAVPLPTFCNETCLLATGRGMALALNADDEADSRGGGGASSGFGMTAFVHFIEERLYGVSPPLPRPCDFVS